jgi:hypothetical protein
MLRGSTSVRAIDQGGFDDDYEYIDWEGFINWEAYTMIRFEPTQVKHDHKILRAVKLKCGYCTFEQTAPLNTSAHGLGEEGDDREARKKFEKLGWRLDKKAKCPECVREEKHTDDVAASAQPALPSPPPRELTRDDRRVIIAKLQEVYVDGKRGYAPPWTDAKVATDLGCPQEWIEKLRIENFGDANGNDDILAAVIETKALHAEAMRVIKDYSHLPKMLNDLRDRLERSERILLDIEKVVK